MRDKEMESVLADYSLLRLSLLILVGMSPLIPMVYFTRSLVKDWQDSEQVKPEAKVKEEQDPYERTFLFEYEGVRVYRFYDNGSAVYFTNKTGEVRAAGQGIRRNRSDTRVLCHGDDQCQSQTEKNHPITEREEYED